jgi:pimeloyl-ACP methyl ester carboxylesterase
MRRLVSAVAAATLLGASLAAVGGAAGAAPSGVQARPGAAPAAAAYQPAAIKWGRCDIKGLRQAGAKCGMLAVPLDYAKPQGTTIKLAVSRIAHTTPDSKAQGPMLVNPGGPGGSGLPYSVMQSWVPKKGGAPFDWIGFDPRGVGASKPTISCDSDILAPGSRPPYVPDSQEDIDVWLARSAEYAQDCADNNGPILEHDDTRTWIKDMESVRKALGEKKISFYGFSYGTYLGAAYASTYPKRVHRFVFDGVVQPSRVWYGANLDQERQFDANIDTFFDWVAEHDAAYGLGADGEAVRQIYYDVLQQLSDDPEPDFGAADWNDVFVGAAYYVYGWDQTAHILAAAAEGDLGPAKEYYGDPTGPGADASWATYLATECTDAPWPADWDVWQEDAEQMHATAPFLAWNNTWFNAPCLTWPAEPNQPLEISGAKVPPILLIAETHDAATPFAGALEVRSLFKRSVLIEGVGGTTHSGSLSGVRCTDNRIARYLKTGKLPARKPGNTSDVKCAPVPPPDATSGEEGGAKTLRERLRQQLAPAYLAR